MSKSIEPWSKSLWVDIITLPEFEVWHYKASVANSSEDQIPLESGESAIYGLWDEHLDGRVECRYVGKTRVSADDRYKGHIDECNLFMQRGGKPTHKLEWMKARALDLESGINITMHEISRVPTWAEDALEQLYIDLYREQGSRLTNGTLGGDGGYTGPMSPEAKSRVAEATRKRMTGKPSPLKGVKQSPEFVRRRLANMDRSGQRDALRKTLAEREARGVPHWAVGNTYNLGRQITDEQKKIIQVKIIEHWSSLDDVGKQEHARKTSEGLKLWNEERRDAGIPHHAEGRVPWNKGIDQGPEVGLKSWATKRANGFISQRDMLKIIAEASGCSEAQVGRTLKGYGHMVKAETREFIWQTYETMKDELPSLVVKR